MGCSQEQAVVPFTCLELFTAVKLGDLGTVERACKQGVVMVDTTYRGATPLGLATARGDTAMVELLVSCGADINKRWKDQGKNMSSLY